MGKIKILAVEDEELHADILRINVDKLGYELIDILNNSNEVINLIKATAPDILLMDIDLGGGETGIDLVKKINDFCDIPVIYLTSFTQAEIFKIAKETFPEAYITKPYLLSQLQTAIELAFFKKQKEKKFVAAKKATCNTNYVFVKEGDHLVKILLENILVIEAYDKYCFVHTRDKKYLLSMTLKNVTEKLPEDIFMQVHRSFVINVNAIEKVTLNNQSIEIGGKTIPVSKSYKQTLFAQLQML